MKVTFLVALNIDDISQIPTLVGDIEEDLTNSGYDVESIAPWARQALGFSPPPAVLPSTNSNVQQS